MDTTCDLNNAQNAKFVLLTDKLLQLTHAKLTDKNLINSYLLELNDLPCISLRIKNTDAVLLLVNQLISVVLPAETSLVRSTCQFLSNLIKAKVSFQGRTRAACKRWILEVLEFSHPLAWNEILLALQNFILLGEFNTNQDLQLLLGAKGLLNKALKLEGGRWTESNLQAMECLNAILKSHRNNDIPITREHVLKMKNIALNTVSLVLSAKTKDQCHDKLLNLCLRVLRAIIDGKLIVPDIEFTGQVLGMIQVLMFHGIKCYSLMKAEALRPAAMNLPERTHIVPKARHSKTPKAKTKKSTTKTTSAETSAVSLDSKTSLTRYSSDSDTSDSDAHNSVRSEEKIRLETARLFQCIVENTPSRDVFGFWPQVVANDSRSDARVLSRAILKEPSSKVRQILLSTLTELLVNARLFLVHAEDVQHSSFITFFGTVSLMLKELHRVLSLCINAEKNVAVLMHALKCVAALVQGTPYPRLKPGLATKIIRTSRLYLHHKDPTVKVAALSVFESLASSDPMTQEILQLLSRQDSASSDSDEPCLVSVSDIGTEEEEEVSIEDLKQTLPEHVSASSETRNMSSLISVCLKNISNEAVSTPVRLQSLKVLGKLTLNVKALILPHLERIAAILIGVVDESETQVVLHACRVLETIAGMILNEDEYDSAFWSVVFDPLVNLLQHTQTTLRAVACDCLGSIGSKMFTQLPRQKMILVITVLFGAVRDTESAVRAAGLRALGMLVALPSFEEDTGFLMDLSEHVCTALEDQNLGVRVKAAWALANLCDCLARRKDDEDIEPVSLNVLLPKLYDVGVYATKDNDKVKCNAVRAVGSVLYLCPDRQTLKDTSIGLDALMNCATLGNDMKVRWNACHALGLVLSRNPDDILPSSWREQVFPALCTLICHSPNFKVRTNAAWALSTCDSYGKYMPLLWKSIILAFENAQHVPSYVEYSHRDALVQQLCLTLSHVAVHTKVSDLQSIWTEISDYTNDVSTYIKQFQDTVLPEKLNDLIQAKGQFEKYVQDVSSVEEKEIAENLVHIFKRSNPYDNLLQE